MKKAAVAIIACLGCAGSSAAAAPSGSWVGTAQFTRGAGLDPFAMSVEVRGRRAVVSLGAGHPARTEVQARVSRGRVRLSLPGRPWRLVLDGRVRGRLLAGTIRQGPARGTFRLRRGAPIEAGTLGLYRFADVRTLAVVQPFGARIGAVLEDGEIRGLYRTARATYAVGAGLQTRNPAAGTATFRATHAVWSGARAERVPVRQESVFVRSGRALLACTLSVPPGSGRRAGVVFAHGAGASPRAFNLLLGAHFLNAGLVVLGCDKRGIGQSGGVYPGEAAVESNIDRYARDVEAQARFLARQPEIDPARVGVSGGSQAGWIMPRAAVREPTIRFLVGFVAPTLTVDETNYWARLTDHGATAPTRSDEELEDEVRASGRSGFDPLPDIRALRVPALWLLGGKDRTVPSRLCVERLDPVAREAGRDFTSRVFPGGTHGLILTANGLQAEAARSNRVVDGLHQAIRDWLAARRLGASPPPAA